MGERRKTGEGIPLHVEQCGKCGQTKPCLIGVRVEDGEPETIYTCPECLDREEDKYLARTKSA